MDSYYRGYIDEIAVYNKALSLSRIQAHYTAGNPAQPASLWVSEMANDGAFEGPFISHLQCISLLMERLLHPMIILVKISLLTVEHQL